MIEMIPLILSSGVALGVFVAVISVLLVLGKKTPIPPEASSFEQERRRTLENDSFTFRILQPLFYELAGMCRVWYGTERITTVEKSLSFCGNFLPWKGDEYYALKHVEGMLTGAMVGLIVFAQLGIVVGLTLGGFIALMYPLIAFASVSDQAKNRLHSIKMRLPFVIDLMALMLESEANFRECLRTAVRENLDHPLGEELAMVQQEIDLGRPRSDALRGFQARMNDDDVRELVFAINKGEELGTPLAQVLRNQADQMRLKRSQWGEKAAAEAQVKMSFPGMLIMVACTIIVMAPILLAAISAFGEM